MTTPKIAIIGAGLSGLTLAEDLKDHADITLFDKSRGIGGRMSTRYNGDFQFDHGAQYFTARTKGFKSFLKPYIDDETVAEWTPKVTTLSPNAKPYKRDWFEPHFTAAPKMSMLCKAIAKNHNVETGIHIETLTRAPEGWLLTDKNATTHGPFDWVISAAPAPQTAALLPTTFDGHAIIRDTKMLGCYSLMLGLETDLDLHWHAAKVKESSIGWIAIDSTKPARDTAYSLLIQSTNDWAEDHIEDDQDTVHEALLCAAESLIDRPLRNATYNSLHRWRYAATAPHADPDNHPTHLIDPAQNLAACGDWFINGHVESAYLSAAALSKTIRTHL